MACGDAVSAAGAVAARGGLSGHPSLSSLRLLYSGFLSPPLDSCTSAPTAPLPPPLLSVRAAVAPPDAPPCPPGPGAGGCVALPVENGSPGLAPRPGRLPALWAVADSPKSRGHQRCTWGLVPCCGEFRNGSGWADEGTKKPVWEWRAV